MRLDIIQLIEENGPLSYGNILDLLKCENDLLAQVISKMEDNDIIKIGKLYHLIDGKKYVKGTVVVRNNNPYLKTVDESIYISKEKLGYAFDKDVVIAEVIYDRYGRKEAFVFKVV